jgi:glycosyltransferase involved in cell wall biosynthesis
MRNKLKKVLFICSLYRPHVGGIETSMEELSRYYKDKGVNSYVLTKKYPLSLKEKETIKGVPVFRILSPKYERDFYNIIDWIKNNENKFKADIVHIIGIRRPLPIIGLILARLWDVPYVVTFSGGDVIDPGDKSTIKLWNEGKQTVPQSILQADWRVAFSKSIRKNAIKTIPQLKSNQIDIIYAGTHPQIINLFPAFKTERPYIIAIRRLFYSKGVDLLIKAFSKLHKKYPEIDLYIIGNGPEKEKLVLLADKLKLSQKIKFLGQLAHEETYSYLRGAMVNVCPSRAEGGGNVNIEAQAASCLAIGSNAGGIPEYIENNITGLIFKSGDIDDLVNKLDLVLGNDKLRRRIVDQAKKKIRRFDWTTISNQYLRGYKKAIKNSVNKDYLPWSRFSKNLWQRLNKYEKN